MTTRGLRRAIPAGATALPARMSFGGKARAILLTIVTFAQFLTVSAGSGVALRADNRRFSERQKR
jgi:hypothetical protein